jgi:hypothetical protein
MYVIMPKNVNTKTEEVLAALSRVHSRNFPQIHFSSGLTAEASTYKPDTFRERNYSGPEALTRQALTYGHMPAQRNNREMICKAF